MNFLKYGYRSFVYFIGFALFFTVIAELVVHNRISEVDLYMIRKVQSAETPFLTSLAKSLSLVGSSRLAIGLSLLTMGLLFFILKHRMELVLFLWVGLGSQILNSYFKSLFHRERPTIHRLIEQTGYSFPSGHSMAAFSLYGIIAFLLWRHISSRIGRTMLIIFTVLMTLGIGWSRIYLGVHYPSDVIGGYASSGAWLMLSVALFQVYRQYKKAPSRSFRKVH